MKWCAIVLVMAAVEAKAFDSAAWDEKRALHLHEAERLQAAYSNCLAHCDQPAEDVTLPIESFDDGSVKLVVTAKRAQYFLKSGLVLAHGVIVRKFKQDGSEDAVIEAESCIVDRYTKSGWAEGKATVTHGKSIFKGRGVYFASAESYLRVFDEADVFSADLKFGGGRL